MAENVKLKEDKMYQYQEENTQLKNTVSEMEIEKDQLRRENSHLKDSIELLRERVFGIDRFKNSDDDISFYTGFPDFDRFKVFYDLLGVSVYHITTPKDKLKPMNQLFLVMCRLRLGLFARDLADRFDIFTSTVSRICNKWIDLIYYEMKHIDIWPSRELVDMNMPQCFKEKYPATRVIIDVTEIQIEKPSSPDLQCLTYSCYESRNTVKALVGITPSGTVSFVSDIYTGSISDNELTKLSGLPAKLEKGDGVMADKGFDIHDELAESGAILNIPSFVTAGQQMSVEDVIETRSIASVRIHVERCMERIKNYHIFDRPIPISLCGLANQMFYVCAVLTNFLPPLIAE
ncbi:uncharacterized protein LOC144435498 [Glandiceps talaboti]